MDSGKKPDYAKVTEGMARCIARHPYDTRRCMECSYYSGVDYDSYRACYNRLKQDALALLKDQADEVYRLRQEIHRLGAELATANRSLQELRRRARTLKAVTVMPRDWAEASPDLPKGELKGKLINALWDEKIIGLRKLEEGENVRMVAVLQALKWDDEEGGTDGEERHRQVEGSDERDIGGHA